MGELSDGASEDNCMIYDLRLQIGVHAFLAGRYRVFKSEIPARHREPLRRGGRVHSKI